MTSNESYYFSTFTTPEGDFSVAVDARGAVAATAFGGKAALAARLKHGVLIGDEAKTKNARAEITAWFKGKTQAFTLALDPAGTPFQKKVWAALRKIPFGETRSYGDVARTVKSAPRAVGRANATNPICLIVPCHRVVGADGSLTGFAFGEDTKRRLLDFEAA